MAEIASFLMPTFYRIYRNIIDSNMQKEKNLKLKNWNILSLRQ